MSSRPRYKVRQKENVSSEKRPCTTFELHERRGWDYFFINKFHIFQMNPTDEECITAALRLMEDRG